MKLVRAAFCDVVDNAAGVAPVLGAEVIGNNLNFLKRVRVRKVDLWTCDQKIVVCLPVQLRVIGAGTHSVGGVIRAIRLGESVPMGGDDARNKEGRCVESS